MELEVRTYRTEVLHWTLDRNYGICKALAVQLGNDMDEYPMVCCTMKLVQVSSYITITPHTSEAIP